ncbi:MAG: hypothetical protein AB7I42_06360 [Bradyrhizobium sp.]|uniref:hypothetical protein n=1 Tax=Bradyrhizobium sp. TaxID=376 RepID=UPI003D14BA25
MKLDLIFVIGGIVATGLTMWSFWGNPPRQSATRLSAIHLLDEGPDLKALGERSPDKRSRP